MSNMIITGNVNVSHPWVPVTKVRRVPWAPNIVRVIKSRRLRWAGHVARMEEGKSAFKI